MEKFETWTANHGWLFWIALLITGAILGSVPGVGPVLFLTLIIGGIWWQARARTRRSKPELSVPQWNGVSSVRMIRGGTPSPPVLAASPDEVRVVGAEYYNGWGTTRGRGDVTLVRQPENVHDPNAVAVFHGGRQIGHLPRDRAALVAPLFDRTGHTNLRAAAFFQDADVVVTIPTPVQSRLNPRPIVLRPLEPWGRCDTEIEVDYEADHRQEIADVFRHEGAAPTRDGSVLHRLPAVIVPSLHPDAPAVMIHDRWVGNVTRARSESISGVVERLAVNGRALRVEANVWAMNDRGTIRANVRLRIPTADQITAPGPMPVGAHVLLPRGTKVQVTGEENYLNEVSALLEGEIEQQVVATLHLAPPASARSTKELVEVRVYDETVGQLTPHMSEHFLALLKACKEEGVAVACHARVKGNQLKADVELDTVRAGELSDQWISAHVYGGGERSR